jgi:hypothetical protein
MRSPADQNAASDAGGKSRRAWLFRENFNQRPPACEGLGLQFPVNIHAIRLKTSLRRSSFFNKQIKDLPTKQHQFE